MQRLKFNRYLERYVRSLSNANTNNIHKLVSELPDNPRLKEPLFLYAYSFNKMDYLLNASLNHPVHSEYSSLADEYEWDEIVKLLENNDTRLTGRYRKVYRSYISRRNMPDTENSTRRLLYNKTRKLQESKGVSNYRLYTDLKLDQSNINAYLKHGDITRINKETAKRMVAYLEAV